MTFQEWVRKWRIGPGMNDHNPRIREFVKELAANTGTLSRYSSGSKESIILMDEQLYSGFDGTVGPGWVPILDRLAEDLVKMGWDRDLNQVKEKFGTLRFYIGNSTDEMEKRIDQAEDETAVTCEECGDPATLKGRGWVVTNCDKCYQKRFPK